MEVEQGAALDTAPEPILDSQVQDDWSSYCVKSPSHVFETDFHPNNSIIASAGISGHVRFYCTDFTNFLAPRKLGAIKQHKGSCRSVKFFPSGNYVVSGGSDGRVVVGDPDGIAVWKGLHNEDAVNKVHVLSDTTFISGDDEGELRVWDIRVQATSSASKAHRKPVMKFHEYEEYISGITTVNEHRLFATCGDRLMDIDLRKSKVRGLSQHQEEDLLCVVHLPAVNQVVCGTQQGSLAVFSTKNITQPIERLAGHPHQIESIVVVPQELWNDNCDGVGIASDDSGDELRRSAVDQPHPTKRNTVLLTSCGTDCYIRVVGMRQSTMKVLGVVGEHLGEAAPSQSAGDGSGSVEHISVSYRENAIASCASDKCIRFHSMEGAINIVKLQGQYSTMEDHSNGGASLPAAPHLTGGENGLDRYGRPVRRGTFFDEI